MTRSPLRRLGRAALRFARAEEGSATIEFALLVPTFLYLFLTTFELGMIMTRDVMVERALDMTVRNVRLGRFDTVNPQSMHTALKQSICDLALMIDNCMNEMKLEMQPVDPRNWSMIDATPDCVDRRDPASRPATNFIPGVANQLMVLRACVLVDPFFPQLGLGRFAATHGGVFTLLSTSAFVIEPS